MELSGRATDGMRRALSRGRLGVVEMESPSKMLSQLKRKLVRFNITRDEGPVCDSGIYCYGESSSVRSVNSRRDSRK